MSRLHAASFCQKEVAEATKKKEKRESEEDDKKTKDKMEGEQRKENILRGGLSEQKRVEGELGLSPSVEEDVKNGQKKEIQLLTSETSKNNKNSVTATNDTKVNLICMKAVNNTEGIKINGNGSKIEEESKINGNGRKIEEERCQRESLSPALVSTLESFLHRKVDMQQNILYVQLYIQDM